MPVKPKLGLIAGNGRFPLLVLEAARAQGFDVVVAAIKEETFPEIENRGAAAVHWLSLGELSRLIETFHQEGVSRAVMAGQVKHKQIFSSIRPDRRLAKLLLNLRTRNTDALLGAIAKVLGDEGITLENSTSLLEPLQARRGVLTRRKPSEAEPRKRTARDAFQPIIMSPLAGSHVDSTRQMSYVGGAARGRGQACRGQCPSLDVAAGCFSPLAHNPKQPRQSSYRGC